MFFSSRRASSHLVAVLSVLCAFVFSFPAQATTLPPGFVESWVAGNMLKPTTMAFAPDGRIFVCEQEGTLRVIKNGVLLPTPFVSLDVDFTAERGLAGVAFDPDFATNKYVYVYYTAKTPAPHNRITRFTANGDVALAGSETVILDLDNLNPASAIHNGGAMHFGLDGKLYVATGENATTSNAQTLSNLLGKMLRMNKDGTIPTDNPFYNTATGKNRLIYALGFRNPFNFDIQPTTGRIFANDVGASAWEEINEVLPGKNYGWPTTEGPTTDSRFTTPTYAYPHGDTAASGCAVTGGAFYNPATAMFPSQYSGKYFFTDYCSGWIRVLDPATKTASDFASGLPPYPVDLKVGPDGGLYYISHGQGAVYKITIQAQTPPTITQQPASRTVSIGQATTFSVSASGSPTLTYQWQRNNVNIAGATSASYTINAVGSGDNNAQFRAIVSNSFGSATSNNAVLTVSSNRAPAPSITSPVANTLYSGGQSISYAGTATDAEDGTLPASAFTWRVDFHHDEHVHPFIADTTGAKSGTFTIPNRGETAANVWYRLYLTVRDAQGATQTVFRDILPRTVQLTLQTNPAGLEIDLDGQPQSTPITITAVVGMIRTLGAGTQTVDSTTYGFQSWSDGGAASHEITTPTANTTYTATFAEINDAANPTVAITAPANGQQLSTLSGISGTVSDTGGSNLDYIDVVITRQSDGMRWSYTEWVSAETGVEATITGNTWTLGDDRIPAGSDLPFGNYSLKAVAFDNAGNIGVSSTITVAVTTSAPDTTNPVIAVVTPAKDSILSELSTVSGTVSDAGGSGLNKVDLVIKRYDNLRWDGTQWVAIETGVRATITNNNWTVGPALLPNGANLLPGTYTLKGVAFDNAGNVITSSNIITIASVSLSSLSISPANVTGGSSATGTVTVSGPAPDDTVITLSSSASAVASVPATITVPMGATTVNFTISTSTRSSSANAVITATFKGVSKSATLGVTANSTAPRPDALIKRGSELEATYALDNVYQSTPAGEQIKTQAINAGTSATYHFKVQNDGSTARSFVLKVAETAATGWSVAYKNGATDITAAIKSAGGFTTSAITPGKSQIITAVMTPSNTAAAGSGKSSTLKVFLNGSDTTVRDSVRATTLLIVLKADALIKKAAELEANYALDNVYQSTPAGGQVESGTVNPGTTATYHFKVQNDGNTSRSFAIKAVETTATGWSVAYKNGAADITTAIKSAGGFATNVITPGKSQIITVTMTPNGAQAGTGKSSTLRIHPSGSDPTILDSARITTTVGAATSAQRPSASGAATTTIG